MSAAATISAEGALVDTQREDSANIDAWGFSMEQAPDTSRQRNRKRKLAAQRVLRGQKPTLSDKGRGRSFTVCICGKFSRNDVGGDLIIEATAMSKTNVGNAQFCGSGWTCADCATHIGITRGSYVEKAIELLRGSGFRIVMTTTTVPHKKGESCTVVFDRLKAAHAKLDAHGSYRALRDKRGYVGRIRSIEVTEGASGWHVHSHDLEVYEGAEEQTSSAQDNSWAIELQTAVFPIWNTIIVGLTGKNASQKHGFTVVPVWSNTDYTVKLPEQAAKREEEGKQRWGAQAELTKAHVKKAEKGGRTPWDILDGCYAGNEADIDLFRDYAQGTWNRTQFETTKRLRELLASYDIALGSDLEIVREEPDFVFADEVEQDDGDQSHLVVDRILIDRASQSAAHSADPLWLENVRHDVELELVMDLPDAMRARGFRLELIEKLRYVATRTNSDAPQGADYDPELAREAAHFEPNLWRAIFVGREEA